MSATIQFGLVEVARNTFCMSQYLFICIKNISICTMIPDDVSPEKKHGSERQ